jgi:hypothetical protein
VALKWGRLTRGTPPSGWRSAGYDPRRIDFDAEGRPLGVELLNVKNGVILKGLPQRQRIALLLDRLRIPAFA